MRREGWFLDQPSCNKKRFATSALEAPKNLFIIYRACGNKCLRSPIQL